MTLQCVLMIIVLLPEMYVAIKANKTNMKYFKKTKTHNEKLVINT